MLYPVFSGRWDSMGVRLHRGLAFEQRACGGGAILYKVLGGAGCRFRWYD